jgi:uncharacterized membrane protein
MIPLYVLLGTLILFRLLGLAGVVYLQQWQHILRAALGVMFLLTASAHWGKRRADLIAMVPPALPNPALLVTFTGILEIVGAIGLQISKLASASAICLFILLVFVFPANVFAAQNKLRIDGHPVPRLFSRAIIQIIFLTALWLAAR